MNVNIILTNIDKPINEVKKLLGNYDPNKNCEIMDTRILAIPDAVKLLLELNALPDCDYKKGAYETPLLKAARNGFYDSAKILIKHEADVNFIGAEEKGALYYSVTYRNFDISRLLIEAGCDVNIKNGSMSRTVLMVLCDIVLYDDFEDERVKFFEYIIKSGADLEYKDTRGMNALFYALQSGYVPYVKLLLDNGASLDVKDAYDRTPFDYVLNVIEKYHDIPAIFKLLLDAHTKRCIEKAKKEFMADINALLCMGEHKLCNEMKNEIMNNL